MTCKEEPGRQCSSHSGLEHSTKEFEGLGPDGVVVELLFKREGAWVGVIKSCYVKDQLRIRSTHDVDIENS